MKGILLLAMSTSLVLASAGSFAASATDLTTKWTCTTNASSSELEADKAADKLMAESPKSAVDSFAFAAQNCRDCTKITCEAGE